MDWRRLGFKAAGIVLVDGRFRHDPLSLLKIDLAAPAARLEGAKGFKGFTHVREASEFSPGLRARTP